MELKIIFMGLPGREKDVKKIVEEFKRAGRPFITTVSQKKLAKKKNEELFGIKARLLKLDIPENKAKAMRDAYLGRLAALALENGFLPLDEEGKPIYSSPPYGFDMYFYSPARGREEEFYELIKGIYGELGDHVYDGQVGSQDEEDGEGEYYMIHLLMQDTLPHDARYRLMLAAYFRILLAARKNGFEVMKQGRVNEGPTAPGE